jgi:hypothetical protein
LELPFIFQLILSIIAVIQMLLLSLVARNSIWLLIERLRKGSRFLFHTLTTVSQKDFNVKSFWKMTTCSIARAPDVLLIPWLQKSICQLIGALMKFNS